MSKLIITLTKWFILTTRMNMKTKIQKMQETRLVLQQQILIDSQLRQRSNLRMSTKDLWNNTNKNRQRDKHWSRKQRICSKMQLDLSNDQISFDHLNKKQLHFNNQPYNCPFQFQVVKYYNLYYLLNSIFCFNSK